jgi:hypothetical protein
MMAKPPPHRFALGHRDHKRSIRQTILHYGVQLASVKHQVARPLVLLAKILFRIGARRRPRLRLLMGGEIRPRSVSQDIPRPKNSI